MTATWDSRLVMIAHLRTIQGAAYEFHFALL